MRRGQLRKDRKEGVPKHMWSSDIPKTSFYFLVCFSAGQVPKRGVPGSIGGPVKFTSESECLWRLLQKVRRAAVLGSPKCPTIELSRSTIMCILGGGWGGQVDIYR